MYILVLVTVLAANQQVSKGLNLHKLWNFLDSAKPSPAALDGLTATGSMAGFYTAKEVDELLNALSEKYPQFIHKPFVIGETYENHQIKAFRIGKLETKSKFSSVLLTALHHAREPISLSMIIRIVIVSLHDLLHPTQNSSEGFPPTFFDVAELLIVPIVNLDSYYKINEAYGRPNWEIEQMRRKNANPNAVCNIQNIESGVDINRNYNVSFAADEIGSVGKDKCDDTYRGTKPFSEPEAQAIKNLIEGKQHHVSAALNFHSYGNMWIWPYNYYNGTDNDSLLTHSQVSFFHRFNEKLKKHGVILTGNSQHTINYTANGEASDWMMKTHGIISLSPELGDKTRQSEVFYPTHAKIVDIINYSQPIVNSFLNAAVPDAQVSIFKTEDKHEKHRKLLSKTLKENHNFIISFDNFGIVDVPDVQLTLRYFHADFASKLKNVTFTVSGQQQFLKFKSSDKEASTLIFSPAVELKKLETHTLHLQFVEPIVVKCQLRIFKNKILLIDLKNYSGNEIADVYEAFKKENFFYLTCWLLMMFIYIFVMSTISYWLSRRRELKKTQHILEFVNVIRAEVEHNISDQNMSFQSHC